MLAPSDNVSERIGSLSLNEWQDIFDREWPPVGNPTNGPAEERGDSPSSYIGYKEGGFWIGTRKFWSIAILIAVGVVSALQYPHSQLGAFSLDGCRNYRYIEVFSARVNPAFLA